MGDDTIVGTSARKRSAAGRRPAHRDRRRRCAQGRQGQRPAPGGRRRRSWLSGGQGEDVFAFIESGVGPQQDRGFLARRRSLHAQPVRLRGGAVRLSRGRPVQDRQARLDAGTDHPVPEGQGEGVLRSGRLGSIYAPVQFAKVDKGLDLSAQHFYGELGGVSLTVSPRSPDPAVRRRGFSFAAERSPPDR